MATERKILDALRDSVVALDSKSVQEACEAALAAGIPAHRAIVEGLSKGAEIIGRKYEATECFLADLIMAGEIMKEGMEILSPRLRAGDLSHVGKVVIGTVAGDLHDIGKNIVATLLQATGFQLIDLGVDVSAEEFVGAAPRQTS